MSIPTVIQELIPSLPSEMRQEILNRCLLNRAKDMLRICERCLIEEHWPINSIQQLPDRDWAWHTPINFKHPQTWSSLFYVYMWYLFNTYHMPLLFDPRSFHQFQRFGFDYNLFDKFWFQVFNEDWRVVATGRSVLHPFPGPITDTVILIVKFNSMAYNATVDMSPLTQLEWVINADGSFHQHLGRDSELNDFCQTTIWRANFLNTGISHNSEDIVSTPEAFDLP